MHVHDMLLWSILGSILIYMDTSIIRTLVLVNIDVAPRGRPRRRPTWAAAPEPPDPGDGLEECKEEHASKSVHINK